MTARLQLASVVINGCETFGAVTQHGFIDLGNRYPEFRDLGHVIASAGLGTLRGKLSGLSADCALDELSYLIPLARPQKIICVGVNYPDRNEEYKDGQSAPVNPSLFVRFPTSFVGHGDLLVRPSVSHQLDYEGELALVIGKAGRHIAQCDALSHIAAITLCNEGTVRDWVRHAKFNVTQGKNFDRSGALGPWLVPFDHEDQIADIRLTTRVNGELRQEDRTSRMTFSFRELIAYISTFATLIPGDIIITGTPTGAGVRFDPPVWLKPGDLVEVEAEGVGLLANRVVDEESCT
ncbi:fumarylacetoacetate hydrolase family protein [Brucella gallinifaecis]|uniref:Fumarylacetoacetate hydrolase family protein n=1 Tax=Brucella gallinifaecis TaxID=215590 RepID=A0A502BLI2_9HYPH|nr:fumarylacetoacetate hydrolase family protein [Brucella gallinifaecis]TPF74687.1 fumarylacetoacetate hydrolase family protein [Brucella gallinifaecis]